MKDRTKEIIKDGFGSLINNAACIRGAKHGPLWLTIVMFVLSLLLPVVPLFVNQANIKGSSFLGSYSYSLEKYIPSIALSLKNQNVKISVTDEHKLSITKDGTLLNYEDYGVLYDAEGKPAGVKKALDEYIDTGYTATEVIPEPKQYGFRVFVSDAETAKGRKEFTSAVVAKKFKLNTIEEAGATDTDVYIPSYMVLFKNAFFVSIYANNQAKAVTTSYVGDYKTMKATDDGLAYLLNVTTKEGGAIEASLTNPDYTNGVLANFKTVMNKSYETLKVTNMWGTSGIYLGVFTGMSLVMGFLMWILTRGKNNPNNYYSPWLTAKIEARLALSPAIITLVAGFFLTSYAPIIFIGTLGLRVMWTSMKELRPVQQ